MATVKTLTEDVKTLTGLVKQLIDGKATGAVSISEPDTTVNEFMFDEQSIKTAVNKAINAPKGSLLTSIDKKTSGPVDGDPMTYIINGKGKDFTDKANGYSGDIINRAVKVTVTANGDTLKGATTSWNHIHVVPVSNSSDKKTATKKTSDISI